MGCVLLHQCSTDLPTGHSKGSIFLTEVPFPHMTWACATLTKKLTGTKPNERKGMSENCREEGPTNLSQKWQTLKQKDVLAITYSKLSRPRKAKNYPTGEWACSTGTISCPHVQCHLMPQH